MNNDPPQQRPSDFAINGGKRPPAPFIDAAKALFWIAWLATPISLSLLHVPSFECTYCWREALSANLAILGYAALSGLLAAWMVPSVGWAGSAEGTSRAERQHGWVRDSLAMGLAISSFYFLAWLWNRF